jgi:hypothetical protein
LKASGGAVQVFYTFYKFMKMLEARVSGGIHGKLMLEAGILPPYADHSGSPI